MPTYTITAPNGKKLKITGDTPPNEKQLNEIFRNAFTHSQKGYSMRLDENGQPDYSDIMNNKNLSKAQKVEAIKKRGETFRKEVDKETNKYINRQRAGAALEIGSAAVPVGGGIKVATALAKAGKPVLAAAVKGAPGLLASGGVYGAGNTLMNKDNATAKDFVKGVAGGAAGNLAAGKTLQAAMKGINPVLNSKAVTKGLPKVQEMTTSVPAEFSERAIQKELAGDSIFKGKFNTKDLNENYVEAGKKAINGLKEAKLAANQELNNATRELNNLRPVDRNQLLNSIAEDIDRYAYGGDSNAALSQKESDILDAMNDIATKNSNSSLHVTKRNLQNLLRGKYGKETGEGINALKDIARNINEELYSLSPAYEKANIAEQKLHDINDLLGGMNRKTIASKLRNVDTEANMRNLYSDAAEELNNLVEPQYKFLDDVRDARAREALEQWYPGQYGGSGSTQGFGNLVRAAVLGGSGLGSVMMHNPALAPIAAGMMSPKIFGKGTIQNIGRLNELGKATSNIYDKAINDYINFGLTAGKRFIDNAK